jgi:hypothetical protein
MGFAPDAGSSFEVDLTQMDQSSYEFLNNGDVVTVVGYVSRGWKQVDRRVDHPGPVSVAVSGLVVGLLLLRFASVAGAESGTLPLESIKLPPGFTIELVARVDNARQMALGSKGTLFVGSMQAGKVHAVRWRSGAPAEVLTLASGLALPVGVAFHGGALYVSAVDRVLRFDDVESHLNDPPKPVVVTDRLPKDRHHGWKFIAFGPDGKLYVPVGAPCNICEPNPTATPTSCG